MARRDTNVGKPPLSRIRVILIVGSVILIPTCALCLVPGLELRHVMLGAAGLMFLAGIRGVAALVTERWKRKMLRSNVGAGRAISPDAIHALAGRLQIVRSNYVGEIPRRTPKTFYQQALFSSMLMIVQRSRFFLERRGLRDREVE